MFDYHSKNGNISIKLTYISSHSSVFCMNKSSFLRTFYLVILMSKLCEKSTHTKEVVKLSYCPVNESLQQTGIFRTR